MHVFQVDLLKSICASPLNRAIFGIICLLVSGLLHSRELLIVDQQGEPVANVILGFNLANTPVVTKTATTDSLAIMDQINKAYVPHVLAIQQGELVDFPNSDNIRHHVYSFSEAKTFEIKMFKGSDSEPVLFDKAGIVVLGCNIHDSMVGYIYVADTQYVRISNSQGKVILSDDEMTAYVWHERLSISHVERLTMNLPANLERLQLDLLPEKPKASSGSTFGKRYKRL